MIKNWVIDNIQHRLNLTKEDRVIFEYGISKMFMILEDILFTLLIGWLLKITVESMIFQFSFMLLRMHAGGCHSKTRLMCKIHSLIVTVVLLVFTKNIPDGNLWIWFCTFICSILIIKFAPVESKNKPLNAVERKRNRKKSIFLIIIMLTLMIVGITNQYTIIYKPIAAAIIGVCFLMMIEVLDSFLRKRKVIRNGN